MKKLVLLSLVLVLAACQSDTKNIEKKLDDLNKKIDALSGRVGAGAAAAPRAPRPEPDRSKTYAVPIDGAPFDGPADAKVTLVKAYDYACGYCEKVRGTMDDLKQKYGNDLRIVYKQLVIHPKNAMVAALGFCAAAKQGKHREMDQLIWDKGFNARQLDLTDVPLAAPAEQPAQGQAQPPARPQMVKCWDHPDGCKNVYGYAAELGLNMDKFKADLKGECQAFVANDGRQLSQFGLSSTPSFFVNGRFISGAQPIAQFSALIDEELKKANERIAAGTPAAQYYQQWVMQKGMKSLTQQ
ncbi:MAG TPA: thioredoxin domain-containing protein [Kofleriaceae bacterium]|nr:thioredoxin domain-containing protein [Kofleriaceae bacterium]